jgi:hypothetical protein
MRTRPNLITQLIAMRAIHCGTHGAPRLVKTIGSTWQWLGGPPTINHEIHHVTAMSSQ